MLERELMRLMSVALALVFPVAVKCCPGFPVCVPESRPWLLSLGAVVICHKLHVMSSVGRAQPGCPWAVVVLTAWCYVGYVSHMMTLKLKWSPVVTYTLSRCVCHSGRVDWHTSLKNDGGRSRYCPFKTLAPSLFKWRPSSLNSCLWPQKILKLSMKLTPFIPQDLCSHIFSPSSRENMFVPLAGSGPLMNDWIASLWSVLCDNSLVLHQNVLKFLVHIRDGCLRKAACRCSPATDVSDNGVAHYQSPGLGCALSWVPLSAWPRAFVCSYVSCWLIRSMFSHIWGFLTHIH